ncbi:MAG: hypothetical protein ACRDJV_12630 [Actinomycetota bacterium]
MNLTLYSFLKFLHVLLAGVAVGFNASYGIWLARVAKEPEHASQLDLACRKRYSRFIRDGLCTRI